MTLHGGTFQRVTVAEAAAILGISPATVRRKLKAGELTGERVIRPQGSAFVVLLPQDASGAPGDASGTRHAPGVVERSNASQGDALAAWAASLLAPIAAELGAARETIVAQAETIAEKEREIGAIREERGRQTAELERAVSTLAAQAEHYARLGRQARRLQIGLGLAVFVVAALLIAAGTPASAGWAR